MADKISRFFDMLTEGETIEAVQCGLNMLSVDDACGAIIDALDNDDLIELSERIRSTLAEQEES